MNIIPEVQERLSLAFPASSDRSLFRAVQEGIFLADHLFEGESFLANLLGRDIRGHLRRVGIGYQLQRYCDRGDLMFSAKMLPMPHGNWHWLEIRGTGAMAHVCRTDDPLAFPADAESRQDARLALQADLLSWSPDAPLVGDILKDIPTLYAWLTLKAGKDGRLRHLCWASPAPDEDAWIAYRNVLEGVSLGDSGVDDAERTPDAAEKLKFKDHIADAIENATKKGADKGSK